MSCSQIRNIDAKKIEDAVAELFVKANHTLSPDAEKSIIDARKCENSEVAKSVLDTLIENLNAAKKFDIPICQDTGMAVVFAEIGQDVHITGGSFETAVTNGVRRAYVDGYLRLSVVNDPLFERKNTNTNTPAVIHTRIVDGDKIKITAAPKGFGSENMSAVKMFNPSASEDDIIDFVVQTVKNAGSKPCPPIVVGVGIGGTFEYAALLAKKALTRDTSDKNADSRYAELECKILDKINLLGIGPQGFGGDTTALAVKINYYPTHIAGLPVAVNINCHVSRHMSKTI